MVALLAGVGADAIGRPNGCPGLASFTAGGDVGLVNVTERTGSPFANGGCNPGQLHAIPQFATSNAALARGCADGLAIPDHRNRGIHVAAHGLANPPKMRAKNHPIRAPQFQAMMGRANGYRATMFLRTAARCRSARVSGSGGVSEYDMTRWAGLNPSAHFVMHASHIHRAGWRQAPHSAHGSFTTCPRGP